MSWRHEVGFFSRGKCRGGVEPTQALDEELTNLLRFGRRVKCEYLEEKRHLFCNEIFMYRSFHTVNAIVFTYFLLEEKKKKKSSCVMHGFLLTTS